MMTLRGKELYKDMLSIMNFVGKAQREENLMFHVLSSRGLDKSLSPI